MPYSLGSILRVDYNMYLKILVRNVNPELSKFRQCSHDQIYYKKQIHQNGTDKIGRSIKRKMDVDLLRP